MYTKPDYEQKIVLLNCVADIFEVCDPSWHRAFSPADGTAIEFRLSDDVIEKTAKVHIRHHEDYTGDDVFEKEYIVLGEFRASKSPRTIGTIVLYEKAIKEFSKTQNLDCHAVYCSVLANEAFRAYHYYCFREAGLMERWFSGGKKENRELVKDSLAAVNEYVFLLNHGGEDIDLASAKKYMSILESDWRCFDIDGWPSSGALGIGGLGLSAVETSPYLSRNLIDLSVHDWKTAADIIKTGYYLSDSQIQKEFNYIP